MVADYMTSYLQDNYAPVPEAGCWIWMGKSSPAGYGTVSKHGRSVTTAHRLFFAFHRHEIPDGMNVLHKCDTPLCVNPDHLFLGTRQDNMSDMAAKGRGWWQKGAKA